MTDPDDQEAIMKRLAGTVHLLRDKENMSLREFSDKVGIPHSDLFRLETGKTKNPSLFLIRKLAKAFNLTVDQLMNFEAKPCPTCGGSGWIIPGDQK